MSRGIADYTIEQWPADIGFVPFVGRHYESGIDGLRVLVLGESHYREDGVDNTAPVTRTFTRNVFGPMAEPRRESGDGRFFPPLDRLLTGERWPDVTTAAAAWHRIAFCNLVQQFAGIKPGDRPTAAQFRDGARTLVAHTLPLLRPDVMLVLGRRTWVELDTGCERANVASYMAQGVRRRHRPTREVWRMHYTGGDALMTWVYHPSRGIDRWEDMHGALQHLLRARRASS